MNTCKKGFYIASERPAALLLDLPLRSIPPTALRLWAPPIHVAMGGNRSRSRQPDASAERKLLRSRAAFDVKSQPYTKKATNK